ncbi:DUF2970 domain-containing protein [Chitinimonas lacunae]|uniref:DUF2970 domain-containing protein n=1 Tax=Chitinimonas lacunae TaxID=1963018 RepID=A0ABV8MNJ8_9NEIS
MSERHGVRGILQAIGAVLSAFSGIRRGKDSQSDLSRLRPYQIIIAGLLCAALLIGGLLTLVRSIVN